MLRKTRNAEKARTESELRSFLPALMWASIVVVSVLSLVLLTTLKPKDAHLTSSNNCDETGSSKSELFHCNFTELEYVVKPKQRELGLSGRDRLEDNQGMVFVFDHTSFQCMWMKDMKFNLDIIWLSEDKKIIKLLKDVSPDTYPESFCAPDTRYVLESNSGAADKLGIGVGDFIQL